MTLSCRFGEIRWTGAYGPHSCSIKNPRADAAADIQDSIRLLVSPVMQGDATVELLEE